VRFLWSLSRGASRGLTLLQKRKAKRQGLAIELSRATIASPHHHEEQSVLMTFVSIPGRHSRSNQYYSSRLNAFGRGPCHGGELWRLCQLPGHPIAHQHGIGARQLRAFAAAFVCPTASFKMKLCVSRFLFFSKLIQSLFPELIVLMGNAPPRAAGTQ
jgi:hypothetical protein